MKSWLRHLWVLLVLFGIAGCDQFGGQGILKVGEKVPVLQTKTLNDVGGDMSKITSYRYPDPRMYQFSFDEAIKQNRPVILEFATPGHCTQCDQQLKMLKRVLDRYKEKIVILHMDQYYNPEAYGVFQVRGEPWTMVIGADQRLVVTMPGRLLFQELDPIIDDLTKAKATPVKQGG